MKSISKMFRIGRGPSSSHTMAPELAATYMMKHHPEVDFFKVILMGSLAKTGKGHGTDFVLKQTFGEFPNEIVFDMETEDIPHPNTMKFIGYKDGKEVLNQEIWSIGGGAIEIVGVPRKTNPNIYNETTFNSVVDVCYKNGWSLQEYVYANEPDVKEHLKKVWEQMQETIQKGVSTEGELPGGLHVKRRAKELNTLGLRERDSTKKERYLISAYAYASTEENAAGGRMVTAPTCGACGVVPACLYYEKVQFGRTDEEIIDALAVAGLIADLIKENASVSGAEAGCQAEIGSACSMAAAALGSLRNYSIPKIEAAAEMAMEHCLGLTCDPVGGLVQIPCIERNATGALRSYDAAVLAEAVFENRKVTFDMVIKTMFETGKDLSKCYRETSEGGLAKLYVNKPN